MSKLDKVLLVYTNDLKEGYLYELEKTKDYDPDYMANEDWCFSATEPSDNHNFENIGGCGFWDKLSNLLFVEDNEQKQKILKEYLNSTQKVFIEIDDIITILKTTHH